LALCKQRADFTKEQRMLVGLKPSLASQEQQATPFLP
jgi:hypothetical protein